MKGHSDIEKRQRHKLLIPACASFVAMLLVWVGLSNASLKLWSVLAVGVFVFLRTLYYATVTWYLRTASLLLATLLIGNMGSIALQYFGRTKEGNFLHFAFESSNPLTTGIFALLFIALLIADVIVKRAELNSLLPKKEQESKGTSTIKSSGGSAVVQNSPGATITTNSGIQPDQASKLVDTVHTQASLIERLISRQNAPIQVKYIPREQDGYRASTASAEYSCDGNIQLVNKPTQDAAGLPPGGSIAPPTERTSFQDISLILQKLETVDDIASEIQAQLDIWNNGIALQLLGKLEEQLNSAESSSFPRLNDYLFLAARVHVIGAERDDSESAVHVERANELLDEIEAQLAGSPKREIIQDIQALRGSIENIKDGPESALRLLGNCDSPYAARIRIAMHLKLKDTDGAVREVRGKQPHLKWCDLGASAYSAAGNRVEAMTLAEWARDNGNQQKYHQCVVRLADSSLARALSKHEPGKDIYPKDISQDEQDALRFIIEDIAPVLSSVISSGSVDSELDSVAIRIGWQVHYLLGNSSEVAKLARLMSTRTPVPPDVARSVVSGFMSPPSDLSQRLRKDHPNDFNVNILAAIVDSRSGDHSTAYKEAKKLLLLADSNDKKEELFGLFQDLWQELDGESVSECEDIAHSLIEHNSRLQRTFDAARALRKGNGGSALEILDECKSEEDTYWLQLRGNALLQLGRLSDAIEMFQSAARLTGVPTLLHKTADLAYQAKKTSVAVEFYEELVKAQPDNLRARANLASLYTFNLHDTGKAAAQFQALHHAEPDNVEHTVNLAVCLSRLYRTDESLALYDEACKAGEPNLRAVLGRAELQLSLGKPNIACDSLQEYRKALWDSPDFLLGYMNIAYAAGEEEIAHNAFQKLNELRAQGLVDKQAFRMVNTDEAIETFRESLKAENDRKNHTHAMMLKGHMPWTWAAQLSKEAIYWAWHIRTQEIDWIGDEPANRASFTIYSTNAFHAQETVEGRRELLPLECPQKGTSVVADLSGLITLHRLDLLDKAADYFSEILIPECYLETVLEDGKKMIVHQRSQQRSADEITRLISSRAILISDTKYIEENGLPTVDEHEDSATHRYRLVDLISPLHMAGVIDDPTYDRIFKICTKESGVDNRHVALERLQDVNVALSTLEAITTFGLLNELTSYYRIHMVSDAESELKNRLHVLHSREETRLWHFDLWNTISDDERFKFVKSSIPKKLENESADDEDFLGFQASFVAQDQGIPLLADDRACQAMTLNEKKGGVANTAFGSEAFIMSLLECGCLDDSTAAEAILKLMRWRYRFIVPSSRILKTYASLYRSNPPGHPLREVAEYLHDCMRDAGLFAGPEHTDLKDSMALRLYLSWVGLLAEWLVEIWSDECFSEDSARQFTDWTMQECFPSQPCALNGRLRVRVAAMTDKILISNMLFRSNNVWNPDRASSAMKSVQAALKLSDEEYQKIIITILNESK